MDHSQQNPIYTDNKNGKILECKSSNKRPARTSSSALNALSLHLLGGAVIARLLNCGQQQQL